MIDADLQTRKRIESVKILLDSFTYRDILIYNLIKIQLFLIFKGRILNPTHSLIIVTRRFIVLIWLLFREQICNLFINERVTLDYGHIFVIDHWRDDLMKMQLDIMQHFKDEELIVVTVDRRVYNRLKTAFSKVYHTRQLSPFSIGRYIQRLAKIVRIAFGLIAARIEFTTVLDTLLVSLDGLIHVDRYWELLSPGVASVVTLCDAHMHEHAIASVAAKKGIKTYTLQHGMIGERYAPVVSDRIFVWGEKSKQELMKFGVPEKKIIISGRLAFDKISECMAQETEIRNRFAAKYGLNRDKLIVAYFATNWGPKENRGLFEIFLPILDLDIDAFIKLRPNFGNEQIKEYANWLEQCRGSCKIPIAIDEDLYQIFTAIDILVSCHSGSAVEAMAFRTVSVVLDIYEHMHLTEILPHYHDCIVVKSKKELKSFISLMMKERRELERQKEISLSNAEKYIANTQKTSAAKLIADFIQKRSLLRGIAS